MELNEVRAIQEFRDQVQKMMEERLHKLALFGSKAEGRDSAGSDIDVLVLVEDEALPARDRILDAAFEVNLKYGVYISPRIIGLSAYEDPVWRMTSFLRTVRERSIPV